MRAAAVPSTTAGIALGLGALVGASLLLRSTALHARYWIDEGLSVGIAQHPLVDIPGLLLQDGSPPLYYLLLGVWIDVAGFGEADTHVLSLAFALLMVPAAFAAGRALFGARAGWLAAALAACNPYLTYYAQETRMYALVAFLGLVVAATFALAFAAAPPRLVVGVRGGAGAARLHAQLGPVPGCGGRRGARAAGDLGAGR